MEKVESEGISTSCQGTRLSEVLQGRVKQVVRVRNTGLDLEMVEQFWAIRLMKAKVFGASMEGGQPTFVKSLGWLQSWLIIITFIY